MRLSEIRSQTLCTCLLALWMMVNMTVFKEVRADTAETQPSPTPPIQIRLNGPVEMEKVFPIIGESPMLRLNNIWFSSLHGRFETSVEYYFRDGKLDGGAAFHLQFFDKNKQLLAEKTTFQLRNRNMGYAITSIQYGGPDRPNRQGFAQFIFRDLSPADIDSFSLEIYETQPVIHTQCLQAAMDYWREHLSKIQTYEQTVQTGKPEQNEMMTLRRSGLYHYLRFESDSSIKEEAFDGTQTRTLTTDKKSGNSEGSVASWRFSETLGDSHDITKNFPLQFSYGFLDSWLYEYPIWTSSASIKDPTEVRLGYKNIYLLRERPDEKCEPGKPFTLEAIGIQRSRFNFYVFTIDPQYGYAVTRRQCFDGGSILSDLRAEDYVNYNGLWLPKTITGSYYHHSASRLTGGDIAITNQKVTFNTPYTAADFLIPWPDNASIFDYLQYTTVRQANEKNK